MYFYSPVAQVVVYPDTLTLDPLQNFQFGVFGHTAAGDSVPVSVHYTNVHYPNAAGFSQFDFEPTKQSVSSEQYMYIDHTHVSVP